MSEGVFILDESLIGCRFEHIRQKNDAGDHVDIDPPKPIGILIGYERVYGNIDTSFLFYEEDTGEITRRRFTNLGYCRVVKEDRHLLVKRLRCNLKFPKRKMKEVSREELIDLD